MESTIGATARAGLLFGLGLLASCGSGGGSTSRGPTGANTLTGTLSVLSHVPADGASQVARTQRLEVSVDGAVVADCLADGRTGLWTAAGQQVAGTATVRADGRGVVFMPAAPLAAATEHVFRLSPLTCDSSGRILDRDFRLRFRTLDDRPPVLTTSQPAGGARGVSQRPSLELQFDEPIDAESAARGVRLTEASGAVVPLSIQTLGGRVVATPVVDLRGDTAHELAVLSGIGGLLDAHGNALTTAFSVPFTTATDWTAPALVRHLPTGIVAPSGTITLEFDESLDAASVRPGTVTVLDQSGGAELVTTSLSADLRALHIRAQGSFAENTGYTIWLSGGAGGPADRSGNQLMAVTPIQVRTGIEQSPLQAIHTNPATAAASVARIVQPRVRFDRPLDPDRLVGRPVASLRQGLAELPIQLRTDELDFELVVAPVSPLAADTDYRLTVFGGLDGAHGMAGTALATDLVIDFRTNQIATGPEAILAPQHGHASLPYDADLVAVFDTAMDANSLHGGTVQLTDDSGRAVPGRIEVARGNRVARFVPAGGLGPGTTYHFTVVGGARGVLDAAGTPMLGDRHSRFRTASTPDRQPPRIEVSLNAADAVRAQDMVVPGAGFTIDVDAYDPERALNPATFEVSLTGAGPVPSSESVFSRAQITANTLSFSLPTGQPLEPGDYLLQATVADLSGNRTTSTVVSFQVLPAHGGVLPFERTQLVWVRFDLDRDGNGRGDFDDDLLRLGLTASGDPAGTNTRMAQLMRTAVLTQAHALLGRDADGNPAAADAVPLRLTERQPLGISHAEIACGGFDPEGASSRSYGDPSSGTLGRAYFDHRNGNTTDRNTATSPGLGVFPAELFLFEARIHQQVYPSFLTSFARGFLPLAPDMGGTPAGTHREDRVVLAAGFVPSNATGTQIARYNAVFSAADDWAVAIGTILAHEVGHSVGLVAEGESPRGLHGDGSLHNALSSATDVMSAAVGYDALITLPYGFRDINMAYLRQRLLIQ